MIFEDKAGLLTCLPHNHSSQSPLLLALHGNQSSALQTLPFWQAAVSQGWVLALPQSTQVVPSGAAYSWIDLDIGRDTIKARFAQLQQHIPFNSERMVLAGHSMGGLMAIQLALRGTLKTCGFVVIGPAVPFLDAPEELESLLDTAYQRKVRGYFIVGANDTDIFADKVHALSEKLQSASIPCKLEIVPEATHDYSPTYDTVLLRALNFMNPSMERPKI